MLSVHVFALSQRLHSVAACVGCLAWMSLADASRADSELRVLYATPQGEVPVTGRISVVFNHPMVALGAQSGPAPFLHISPPLEGAVKWHGTSALEFVPKGNTLPYATHFTIVVDAAVTDLGKRKLKAPFRFEFDTPVVRVTFETPPDEWLLPSEYVRLTFEPAVEPAELKAHLSVFTEARGKRVSPRYSLLSLDEQRNEYVEIQGNERVHDVILLPDDHWPYSALLHVQLDPELRIPDGPRPLGSLQSAVYHTADPFRVWLDCGETGCRSSEPRLVANRRLEKPEEHLRLSPSPEGLHVDEDFSQSAARSPRRPRIGMDGYFSDPEPKPELLAPLVRYWISPLEPLTDYRLQTISPFVSLEGEQAKGQLTWRFRTPALPPSVDWEQESRGATIEASLLNGLGVRGAGGPAVAVQTMPLSGSELEQLFAQNGSISSAGSPRANAAASLLSTHWRTVMRSTSRRSQSIAHLTNQELFAGERPVGPWLLGAKIDAPEAKYALRWLQPTSLYVTAWRSPKSLRVWVRDRNQAQPVARARVALHGVSGHAAPIEHETDVSGEAAFALAEIAPPSPDLRGLPWLSIRRGNEWVALPLGLDSEGKVTTSAPVERSSVHASLWSDRDLYEPGETAHLFGIAREWRDPSMHVPPKTQIRITVEDSHGKPVRELQARTEAHGFYSADFRIPKGTSGSLQLYAGPDKKPKSAYRAIHVEPFTPTPLQLAIQGLAPEYRSVSSISWQYDGKYLTQAPTSDAQVTAEVTRVGADLQSLSQNGWQVYAPIEPQSDALPEKPLDGSGSGTERYDIAGDVFGPEQLVIDASLTDKVGRVFSTTRSTRVYRSRYFIGLRQPRNVRATNSEPFPIEVAAFTPEGVFVPGVQVEMGLLTSPTSGAGGTLVQQTVATTSTRPVQVWLEAPTAEWYTVNATARDRALRIHSQSRILVVDTKPKDSRQPEHAENREPVVIAEFDRASYWPAHVAKLTATLPFAPARVQLLVGRGELRHQQERIVNQPTCEFAIPFARDLGRNVEVTLLAYRVGGRPSAQDRKSSAFLTWQGQLRRDPESYRLGVSVVPSRNYAAPKDWITLDVFTKDAQGRPHPSVVTLYAVDEGNLLLTDYVTPDPIRSFTRDHPTEYSLFDLDQDLTRFVFVEATLGHGYGTAGGTGAPRIGKNARRPGVVTPLFRSGLPTDSSGKLQVQFQLPGDLTRYRVMAVAASDDDAYGNGETAITSRLPVSTAAVLPKVTWRNDQFEAEVTVTSFLNESREIAVRTRVSGLSLRSPEVQRVRVAPRRTEVVRFTMRADRIGKARLIFETDSGNAATDSVEYDLEIREPADTRIVAAYGSTQRNATQAIAQLSRSPGTRQSLGLTIGNSPVTTVPSVHEQLRRVCNSDLNHQTTEALAIALLESVALGELKKRTPTWRSLPPCIDELRRTLRGRQYGDGGFCAFSSQGSLGGSCNDPELTALVIWVLDREELNEGLGREMLKHAVKYLARRPVKELAKPANALALRSLARNDALAPEAFAAAYERRKHWPAWARAWLMVASGSVPSATSEQRALLEKELVGQVRLSADRAEVVDAQTDELGHYLSNLGDTASVLYALLVSSTARAMDGQAVIAPLLRGLGILLSKDSDDLSRALGFVAFNEYLSRDTVGAQPWLGRVRFGNKTVLEVRTEHGPVWGKGVLFGRDLAAATALEFERGLGGPLFYTARLSVTSPALPQAPEDHGIAVEQEVYRMSRTQPPVLLGRDPVTVRQGDVLKIVVTLTLPSPRHGVWIDVPLPAQFEVIDRTWRNTETWLDDKPDKDIFMIPSKGFYTDGTMRFYLDRPHAGIAKMQLYVRAMLRGESTTPPTAAKETRNPEVFGRTGLQRWVVKGRK